jgi:hypothetical protein
MAEKIPNKWEILKEIGSNSAVEVSRKNAFRLWNK